MRPPSPLVFARRAALFAIMLSVVATTRSASAACGFDVLQDFGKSDPVFQACLDSTCCNVSSQCADDKLCYQLFRCIETKCAPKDDACMTSCLQSFPANQTLVTAYYSCEMSCSRSSGPAGGSGGNAGTFGAGATSGHGTGATSGFGGSVGFGGTAGFGGTTGFAGKPSGAGAMNPFASSGGARSAETEDGAGGAADPQTVAFCATNRPGSGGSGDVAWVLVAAAVVASRRARLGAAR